MLSFIKGVLALAETFKLIKQGIDLLVTLYIDNEIKKNSDNRANYEQKRVFLLRKIKGATTDEERIMFSAVLDDINNSK